MGPGTEIDVKDLEEIALGVRNQIFIHPGVTAETDQDHLCGRAAELVKKELLAKNVTGIKQAFLSVEYLGIMQVHTLIFIGPDFRNSHKIDPSLPQYEINQYVFEPDEEYPLDHIVVQVVPIQ
tara:strand:- start:791 stop:1159 length:369 start_codon:yes stop_codon:yes gene_type:complete